MHFGAVVGGPEVHGSHFWKALQKAWTAVPEIPPEERESFVLLLHLHIPGSILRDFKWTGLRTSSSSKEEKWAAIQAAVPEDVVDSPDAAEWLVATIRDAIPLCEKKCKRQKYPFDRELHYRFLATIEEALGVGGSR